MSTIDRMLLLLDNQKKSQKELADFLGVGKNRITDWKSGRIKSYTKYLPQIAEYLNVSIDYLLGKEDTPTKAKNVLRVPVYGHVAAGVPIEAIEDIEDYEELDGDIFKGDYIALKIHGDSMEPRMTEGDVVIVRLQADIESGDIAIVMINGDNATCKKIKKTPEGVMLISTNPNYEPMFYNNREIINLPVRVIGKVVELRAKF